jgi:hypothetical protein
MIYEDFLNFVKENKIKITPVLNKKFNEEKRIFEEEILFWRVSARKISMDGWTNLDKDYIDNSSLEEAIQMMIKMLEKNEKK